MRYFIFFPIKLELAHALDTLRLESESLVSHLISECHLEVLLHLLQIDSVLGSLGATDGWLYSTHVELHDFARVDGVSLGAIVGNEEVLGFQVVFYGVDLLLVSAC